MEDTEQIQCGLEGCEEFFTPRVHNQRFHDPACTRIYTNARILAAYHEKKNRKMDGRVCKQRGCITRLSRYNEGTKCSVHEQRDHIKKLQDWGWETDDEGNFRFDQGIQ